MEQQVQTGWTRREIAQQIGVTVRTLDRYRKRGQIHLILVGDGHYLYTQTKKPEKETEDRANEPHRQESNTTDSILFNMKMVLHTLDPDFDFIEEKIEALEKRIEALEKRDTL